MENQRGHLLLLQNRRQKAMEISSNGKSLRRQCMNPSCDFWHPPVCQNCKTESGCNWRKVNREVGSQPNTRQKKKDGKGSVALLKNSRQLSCVLQDSEPPKSKSILRKSTKSLGPKRSVHFSRGTLRHSKIRERKVHRRVLFSILNLMSVAPLLRILRTDLRKKP